ncbi:MAG: hypothetical protein SH808_04100 [Saprospiraceae bacterium]|mgnify:CR=1 FL=1|nr:hypothetical protein [Saprospiraceae bacterium]
MKNSLLIIICVLCCCVVVHSQSSNIRWIELSPEGVITSEGNLSEGIDMPDLSWAWNSAVACFPATQAAKFTGKHVLYALDIPAYTELEIDLIPADKNANFSLYAYEVGTVSASNTVPTLSQCIRCEADHKWDYKVKGKTQDHTRHVRDILALANPYQVIIGVVGSNELKEGAYRLEVRRKGE